jgi:hypothetical protein
LQITATCLLCRFAVLRYGRRATSRIGTQLSGAIYDKALRIADQSGIVASASASQAKSPSESNRKAKGDSKKDATGKSKDAEGKPKDEKDSEKKSGADVGKIVNLMGIDAWGFIYLDNGLHTEVSAGQSKVSETGRSHAVYLCMYSLRLVKFFVHDIIRC